jgi:hypothetical protein
MVRVGSWLRDNALTQPATVHDPVNVVRHGRSEQMRKQLIENYEYFFGPLRLKSEAVPSDEFRKAWVVSSVCDLIQARRDWVRRYAQLMEI